MSDTINIYRRRQADPFARIPHTLLCDPALTWKAKGILCYLLSKPDYWKARERDIENRGADGVTAVASGLREIRQAGYAQLVRVVKKGQVVEWRLLVSDSREFPQKDDVQDMEAADDQMMDGQNLESHCLASPSVENNPLSKNEESKKESSNKQVADAAPKEQYLSLEAEFGSSKVSSPPTPQDVPLPPEAKFWNANCGSLPKVERVAGKRAIALEARRKSGFWLANFQKAVKRVAESDFCNGRLGGTWRPDFEWMLSEGNLAKVVEGKYDNRGGPVRPAPTGEKDILLAALR